MLYSVYVSIYSLNVYFVKIKGEWNEMKKVVSLILALVLSLTSTVTLAVNENKLLSLPDISIELLSDHTYYIDDQLQGKVSYLIEGEVFEYFIESTTKETVVLMKSENHEEVTEVTYNKEEQLIKANGTIIAEINETSNENPITVQSAGWSERPPFGTPSDYNILASQYDGSVRFSESLLSAAQGASAGVVAALVLPVLIASTNIALIAGIAIGAIVTMITYNPQDAAYFAKWKYNHRIYGYYKYVTRFYYDSSHNNHVETSTVYSTSW